MNIFKDPEQPKAFVQISEGKERHPPESHSWMNDGEARACTALVNRILETREIHKNQLAVIAMYAGQEQELRKQFDACEQLKGVSIGTVDSSQGKEWDLVVVCTTRTKSQATGFCTDVKSAKMPAQVRVRVKS